MTASGGARSPTAGSPWLPMAVGLLPMLVVAICLAWSLGIEAVPRCNPFLEGCMSISAACRSVPVVYLFRVVMLPCCVLLVVFWWRHARHLRDERVAGWRTMRGLGVAGSAFLVLYVLTLGTDGALYAFMRRSGIYVFFAAAGIAQVVSTWGRRGRYTGLAWRLQQLAVVLMLLTGPLALVLKSMLAEASADTAENIIEWHFATMMFGWYALVPWTRREPVS